jgi:hypothetical protein
VGGLDQRRGLYHGWGIELPPLRRQQAARWPRWRGGRRGCPRARRPLRVCVQCAMNEGSDRSLPQALRRWTASLIYGLRPAGGVQRFQFRPQPVTPCRHPRPRPPAPPPPPHTQHAAASHAARRQSHAWVQAAAAVGKLLQLAAGTPWQLRTLAGCPLTSSAAWQRSNAAQGASCAPAAAGRLCTAEAAARQRGWGRVLALAWLLATGSAQADCAAAVGS